MMQFLALALLAGAASVSSQGSSSPPEKAVWYPTLACENEFYKKWATEARAEVDVRSAGTHSFKFDPEEYNKEFILHHNEDLSRGQLNFFFFELYKPVGSSEEPSSGQSEVSEPMEEQNPFLPVLPISEEKSAKKLPREGDDSLTVVEIEDMFLQKERQGEEPLLNRGDIADAIEKKQNLSEENSSEEIEITSGFLKGLKLKKKDLVNIFYGKKPEEKKKSGGFLDGLFENTELKQGTLERMSYDERPKLYITHRRKTTEYALRLIQMKMPSEVYNSNNRNPIHVMVTLYFEKKGNENELFMVDYPIYATEEDVEQDEAINNFVESLAKNEVAKMVRLPQNLNFLLPALESISETVTPVYQDTARDGVVALADCEYIQDQNLRDLFNAHHLRLMSHFAQETTILPVESYREKF